MPELFYFKTSLRLIQLLGIRAKNLPELLQGIKTVPLSSIYYHTHRLLYQQLTLYPEPPNDFAYWVNHSLNIKELGESLASMDIIKFNELQTLKDQFINIINEYIINKSPIAIAPKGQEFHFMDCQTFVLPTPYVASNIREFLDALKKVSINSLYFHLIESIIRLRNGESDFSRWLKENGETKAGLEIGRLDFYTITLEGLRKRIITILSKYASA